jgi:hypothetical protein
MVPAVTGKEPEETVAGPVAGVQPVSTVAGIDSVVVVWAECLYDTVAVV